MLDKKGKLFGKVSIIDILVVLILIITLIGAAIAAKKISNKTILTENKSLVHKSAPEYLEVEMRLSEVRDMTANAIFVGDEVYTADTNKYLGEIISVNTEQATRIIYDNQGNTLDVPVPERYDVILTVKVPGSRLNNGYFTSNNIQLVYDSTMEIKTVTVESIPTIEKIKLIASE